MEGRRSRGSPQHGSHSEPGLEMPANFAAGFVCVHARSFGRRERGQAMTRRAVFLDRDGVINRVVLRDGKPYPPAGLSGLRILPGVREACRSLHEAGFLLI